ncbi:YugN-like family protein [Bacillus sp. 1P06AnD]|uniref:YugN-like family protein n=1 Tax=Bacillus sp. 1P06AnD TaxID=3132208 RepID=UPI0039A1012C
MKEIPSRLTGKQYNLLFLEKQLKPLGYSIGGGWDYDHGYFDYKLAEVPGYVFLRLPVQAVRGELDERGVSVRIGTPFVLGHQYQSGIDTDFADAGPITAVFNQFAEPVEKDSGFDSQFIALAKALVSELEQLLLGEA